MSVPAAVVCVSNLSHGHPPYPPRAAKTGSPDVFVNGKAVMRIGDLWENHCFGENCHDGNTTTGSTSVFVNGLAIMRVKDVIRCNSGTFTDFADEGSSNVFCGFQEPEIYTPLTWGTATMPWNVPPITTHDWETI